MGLHSPVTFRGMLCSVGSFQRTRIFKVLWKKDPYYAISYCVSGLDQNLSCACTHVRTPPSFLLLTDFFLLLMNGCQFILLSTLICAPWCLWVLSAPSLWLPIMSFELQTSDVAIKHVLRPLHCSCTSGNIVNCHGQIEREMLNKLLRRSLARPTSIYDL